jgi:Mn2+/Fe2+ NRAMP family transporter
VTDTMILMASKKEIMGEYANKRYQNVIGWICIVSLTLMTLTLLRQ